MPLCNSPPPPRSSQASSHTSASIYLPLFSPSRFSTLTREVTPNWSWMAHPHPLPLKCFVTSLLSWDKNQMLNMAHPWGPIWCGMCLIYYLLSCLAQLWSLHFLFPFPSLSHLLWPLPSPCCPVSSCSALPSHLRWHFLREALPAHPSRS